MILKSVKLIKRNSSCFFTTAYYQLQALLFTHRCYIEWITRLNIVHQIERDLEISTIYTKVFSVLHIRIVFLILFHLNSKENSIHQHCLEFIVIEVYVISDNELYFQAQKNTSNLRNFYIFECQNPKTKQYRKILLSTELVRFGKLSQSYRVSQIWQTNSIRDFRQTVLNAK